MLGCSTYRCALLERGGATTITEIPHRSLSLGRVVDGVSSASLGVNLDGAPHDCLSALSEAEPWEHELGIWRSGSSSADPDWVGPLMEPDDDSRSGVTLQARDLGQWFERRGLLTDRTHTATDLATIFSQYVTDALSEDDPGITVESSASGIVGDRKILGIERTRAADAMRELARSGVDFTMIGRRLIVGGQALDVPAITGIFDPAITAYKYGKRGLDGASRVTVKGDIGTIATVGGVRSDIGLVEQTFSESSIKDITSATAAAQAHLDMLAPSPPYLEVTLAPEAPVAFSELICGTLVEVGIRTNLGEVTGNFRLQSVNVSATAGDLGDTESISLQLIPVGAE